MIALLCICCTANAQNNTVATGGNASGTQGSMSYSIGQVHYIHPGSITEGLQQPLEILTSDIEEFPSTFSATLYPNPTGNSIVLKIESSDMHNLKYELFDLQGKLMSADELKETETNISLTDFPPMTYVLRLSTPSDSKSYKIIKR